MERGWPKAHLRECTAHSTGESVAAKLPKNMPEAASLYAEAFLLKALAPHNNSVAVELMARVIAKL